MKSRVSFTTKVIIIVSALIMILSAFFAVVLIKLSGSALKTLINDRMLDISNTAAAMLDGDAIEHLTAEDADTEEYKAALKTLAYFQENIDLKYIYCISRAGERDFVFSIDPTVEDPGEFGSPIKYTDALYQAYTTGVPCVDEEPYSDAWGRFYSSYSPVFDSEGKVACVVAVDFSASWYETQLKSNTVASLIIGLISILVGVASTMIFTNRLRKRLRSLENELSEIAVDAEKLTNEIRADDKYDAVPEEEEHDAEVNGKREDEIVVLGRNIRALQNTLKRNIELVREKAYIDEMTGVRNKTAYLDTVKRLEKRMSDPDLSFSVAVFDINGLKTANDNYGHEYGDMMIKDSVKVMKEVFGENDLYRIGGDEFIAVLENVPGEVVREMLEKIDARLKEVEDRKPEEGLPFAFSKGGAVYSSETDSSFHEVFKRADDSMYEDKAEYYRTHGDRRRRRGARPASGPKNEE